MNFMLTTCPLCAGRGQIAADHGTSSCSRCHGAGSYLANDQATYYQFVLPPVLTPHNEHSGRFEMIVRYTLTGGAILVFLLSLFSLLSHARSVEDVLWQHGGISFIAGVSGLLSLYGVSRFQHHQTSFHPLNELPEKSDSLIDLFDYANPRVRTLLDKAAYTAAQNHTNELSDDILLTTLLNEPRIQGLLARLEDDPTTLQATAAALIGKGREEHVSAVLITPQARERFYTGFHRAYEAQFPYMDLEDILLAYAEDPGRAEDIFKQVNLTKESVYAMSRWYAEEQDRERQWAFWLQRGRSRPKGFMNRAWTALPTPLLDQVSIDITRQAGNGQVLGTNSRPEEVQRVLEVLGSTEQNNVILLGEPGVGTESILETVALRMLEENVPEVLKDKRLVQLDATALITNGSLEIVESIITEIQQAGNVILAVPELQVLTTNDASLNPATILTNGLKQRALQIISTASYADYHTFIEKNSALTQLITVVEVAPATNEQALEVLEEHTPVLETKNSVFFTFASLQAAIDLGNQYLAEMASPSGALALLGEAASAVQGTGKRWVRKSDVELGVEKRTSIPIRQASEQERENLLNLEVELHKRVIGQEQAITAVAGALRRARAGFGTKTRPIASFLFVGPTGVGKTETAKAVGELLFGEHGHFIRLDMSEYQDSRSIYRLIGAPGEQAEGGELTQAVREHPYSLILLDEIEKADPTVHDLFLQVLEDGRLTENTGRTVHFQNCIIVATSNAASRQIIQLLREGIKPEELPKQVLILLQQSFKPEFLNRFDGIIPFESLTPEQLSQVVTIMLQEVIAKAKEQGIQLVFDISAIQKIATLGFDPEYGARPLRRVIQDKVEGLLAKLVLKGSINRDVPLQITGEMIE